MLTIPRFRHARLSDWRRGPRGTSAPAALPGPTGGCLIAGNGPGLRCRRGQRRPAGHGPRGQGFRRAGRRTRPAGAVGRAGQRAALDGDLHIAGRRPDDTSVSPDTRRHPVPAPARCWARSGRPTVTRIGLATSSARRRSSCLRRSPRRPAKLLDRTDRPGTALTRTRMSGRLVERIEPEFCAKPAGRGADPTPDHSLDHDTGPHARRPGHRQHGPRPGRALLRALGHRGRAGRRDRAINPPVDHDDVLSNLVAVSGGRRANAVGAMRCSKRRRGI